MNSETRLVQNVYITWGETRVSIVSEVLYKTW
jgi:hypothetical protein